MTEGRLSPINSPLSSSMTRSYVERFQEDAYKRAFENLGKTVDGELRELRMQEQHNLKLLQDERNLRQFRRDMQIRNRDILQLQMRERQQLVRTQKAEDMKSWIEPEYYGYPNRPHHYEDPNNLKLKAMQKHVKQSLENQMREKRMLKKLKVIEEDVVDKYCLSMAHKSLINDNMRRKEKQHQERENLKYIWGLTEKTNAINKAIDQLQRGKYSSPEVLHKTHDQLNILDKRTNIRNLSVSPDSSKLALDVSLLKAKEPRSIRHSVEYKKEAGRYSPDIANKREVKSRLETLAKKEEYIQNEKLKLMKTIAESSRWSNPSSPTRPKNLAPLKT
jgi:hypothetical protein